MFANIDINFGNDIINWEKEHVYLYFYYSYIILLYLHYLYTLRIQCIENKYNNDFEDWKRQFIETKKQYYETLFAEKKQTYPWMAQHLHKGTLT